MNIVKAIIAICILSSLMYAAYPADVITVEENGEGYSKADRIEMDVLFAVQMPQEEITFYVDKRKQLAALFNAEAAHGK